MGFVTTDSERFQNETKNISHSWPATLLILWVFELKTQRSLTVSSLHAWCILISDISGSTIHIWSEWPSPWLSAMAWQPPHFKKLLSPPSFAFLPKKNRSFFFVQMIGCRFQFFGAQQIINLRSARRTSSPSPKGIHHLVRVGSKVVLFWWLTKRFLLSPDFLLKTWCFKTNASTFLTWTSPPLAKGGDDLRVSCNLRWIHTGPSKWCKINRPGARKGFGTRRFDLESRAAWMR